MLVLGVETSCDDTGVALYDTQEGLLAHAVHSQTVHQLYGGVVPELASRDHIKCLPLLFKQVLAAAQCSCDQIDGFAYTQGPGLSGALLVGAQMTQALAYACAKPVIGIHHLEGHLLSPLLTTKITHSTAQSALQFPFLALLVSGGHTQLTAVYDLGDYQLLGETLDDAVGEAFDKIAQLLGLGYPGGKAVSECAQHALKQCFRFPRPMLSSPTLNMSFSGLKTAVLTQVNKLKALLSDNEKAEIAYGFTAAVVDVLLNKSLKALKKTGFKTLVVCGGVSANQQLRAALNEAAYQNDFCVYYPDLEFCSDNGAMIAFAAALRFQRWPQQKQNDYRCIVYPRWELSDIRPLSKRASGRRFTGETECICFFVY